MGLLDQLWDDTVAGPRPDIGLGKLRKTQTFSFGSSSGKGASLFYYLESAVQFSTCDEHNYSHMKLTEFQWIRNVVLIVKSSDLEVVIHIRESMVSNAIIH